jgi:molecular chaperone GrpE
MSNNENPPVESAPEGQTPAGNGSGQKEAAPAPAEQAIVEQPEEKARRLEREKAETHDRLLRMAAEFENYKRRARRDVEEAASRGREALLREMLTALDNLDRALAHVGAGGKVEALAEGVRMVEKQFLTALEKFDVKRFDSVGQPFDPARHEAIQQVETSEVPPGAVAMQFARGYMIGDRLLRPAMVAVAKAPPAAGPPDEGASPDGGGGAGG